MKARKGKIRIIVEKTKTGFSAYAAEYTIFTTAKTMNDLLSNSLEACNLFFEAEGTYCTIDNLKIELDFKQFFRYYRVINSKFLADKIGMNPTLLSQYVQGRKKPSEAQTQKILSGIQQIGKELAEIKLVYK